MSNHDLVFPSLEHCVKSIDAAYQRLSHTLGWRFVTGPRRTFQAGVEFAFITLNPAGKRDEPDHPRPSSENGSAYWVESWEGHPAGGAPLQRQVQELFNRVAGVLGVTEPPRAFVENRVLTAHFIPFRSPSIDELPRRIESTVFSRQLWSHIFAAWLPRTILTMDRDDTFTHMTAIILEQGARLVGQRRFPTGWGSVATEARRFRVPGREDFVTLARLPHLSRFKLMSREACREPVQGFLDYVYQPFDKSFG